MHHKDIKFTKDKCENLYELCVFVVHFINVSGTNSNFVPLNHEDLLKTITFVPK
jgi:hypothetical protein